MSRDVRSFHLGNNSGVPLPKVPPPEVAFMMEQHSPHVGLNEMENK